MAEGLERRLMKNGALEIYNKALQEVLDRDCIAPISEEEIEEHMSKWRKTSLVGLLYHTPRGLNVSDIASRGLTNDEDNDVGYVWKEGTAYLKYKREMANFQRVQEKST